MVRNVRKPSGSLPGKVIYTDYSTVSVSADEALAENLRVEIKPAAEPMLCNRFIYSNHCGLTQTHSSVPPIIAFVTVGSPTT